MINFEHYNPTRIVFGKDQLHRLAELLKEHSPGNNILLAYGGQSAHKTGLLDRIKHELSGFSVSEFGGIEANPQYTTLMRGVEKARNENIDLILAVGGGSVIDGVKFMCGAYHYEGDPWDVLERKEGCSFSKALPFGTVLTLPATGSEANSGAVISRDELKEKQTMGGPLFFPRFSFCDPSLVTTLPTRQIANGIVDAYMHTLEQYLTFSVGNKLQERQAEAILSTLIEIAPAVMADPSDYTAAANLMWCATHALNGNLRLGVPTDWTTHMIGHELTALYGIDHARTLAIIAPRLFENQFSNKRAMLAQYGRRVWHLEGNEETVAKNAIEKTEAFFNSLQIETRISDYTTDTTHLATIIRERFEKRGWNAMGEHKAITPQDVESIVNAAI
jgi:NADP-dependent alcohol dehydrogenase